MLINILQQIISEVGKLSDHRIKCYIRTLNAADVLEELVLKYEVGSIMYAKITSLLHEIRTLL